MALAATMTLENLSRRDKILFDPKLGLRYDASTDQLRLVLTKVQRLFYQHPKVENRRRANLLHRVK